MKNMKRDCKIIKDNTMNVFKDQLYEYLKSYTSGDTNNVVISGGPGNAFES